MEILKKRSTAAVVLAVTIVLFTFIGAKLSLTRLSGEIEEMFTEGVYLEDEDYTSASIDDLLTNRIEASLGLITVASNYDTAADATEELRAARIALIDANSIAEKYDANLALETAWQNLTGILAAASPSDDDAEDIEYYAGALSGSSQAISSNKYNSKVSEFNEITSHFPADVLKSLTFVEGPEYFG